MAMVVAMTGTRDRVHCEVETMILRRKLTNVMEILREIQIENCYIYSMPTI